MRLRLVFMSCLLHAACFCAFSQEVPKSMAVGQSKIFFSEKNDVFVKNQKEILSFLMGMSDMDVTLFEEISSVEVSFLGKDGVLKSIPFSEIYLQLKQQRTACLRCILQDIESRIHVESRVSAKQEMPPIKR